MTLHRPAIFPRHASPRLVLVLALAGSVAACTPAPRATGINDPHEAGNRQTHEFNRGVDRYLYRPVSQVYGQIVPEPIRTGVRNFSNNLELPINAINGALQGRPKTAVQNLFRFAINTTIGVFGIFDPAGALGLPEIETDFGETMHVWGVGEGNFVELPFLGPSTNRDFVGMVVDVATNPLGFFNLDYQYQQEIRVGSKVASTMGQRYTYSDFLDSILYGSADSYAQARQLYLQSRRNALNGGEDSEEDFYDPYDDHYAQE